MQRKEEEKNKKFLYFRTQLWEERDCVKKAIHNWAFLLEELGSLNLPHKDLKEIEEQVPIFRNAGSDLFLLAEVLTRFFASLKITYWPSMDATTTVDAPTAVGVKDQLDSPTAVGVKDQLDSPNPHLCEFESMMRKAKGRYENAGGIFSNLSLEQLLEEASCNLPMIVGVNYLYLLDIETHQELADAVKKNNKGSLAWLSDFYKELLSIGVEADFTSTNFGHVFPIQIKKNRVHIFDSYPIISGIKYAGDRTADHWEIPLSDFFLCVTKLIIPEIE